MKTYTFSPGDRKVFQQIAEMLGQPCVEVLKEHMGAGVFDGRDPESEPMVEELGRAGEPLLRRAGLAELSMLLGRLGFKERRSLMRRLPGLGTKSVRRTADEPPPTACVLRSLQASLLGPGHRELDVELRAGLHRLGRATADMDASAFLRITASLPAAWRRCSQAAWFRLSQEEECRDSAERLRKRLLAGGESWAVCSSKPT